MLLLKGLTIILGLLVAGSRGVCLVSPATSRKMMKGFLDRPLFVHILGLVAAIFGVALFYAARRAIWLEEVTTLGQGIWALILGAIVCIAGLAVLIKPAFFTGRLNWMMGKSDGFIRVMMGIGFVVGLAILAYGIWGLTAKVA